jgi:hypothetical protein
MKDNKYGQESIVMGYFKLVPEEMCFVQYLPIAFPTEQFSGVRIPQNLKWCEPLVNMCMQQTFDKYIYLTVKHLYVTPSNMGNRPGWHSDGFGTDDINYIWCDNYPTEFCIQDFNLSEDCDASLKEMEQQAKVENVKTYGENTLLRLDKYNIHRTPVIGEGYRTFVKISVSKDRYNLKGNAHNCLFDYDWEMVLRSDSRNHPSK